jgi:hypothetical protein
MEMTTIQTIDVMPARAALLELHRQLLQAQRVQVERAEGRMSAAAVLQAATDDLRFGWLSPLSGLISELDRARADADADGTQATLAGARSLLAPPDPGTWFGARYLQMLQEHPEVVLAHRDATAALTG